MPETPSLEYIRRIRQAQEWMLNGHRYTDIVTSCVNNFGVDERTAKRYIAMALEGFTEETQQKMNQRKGFYINARMKLFRDLKDKDKARGARAAEIILRGAEKLEGMHIKKVDITKDVKFVITTKSKRLAAEQTDESGSDRSPD